MVLQASDIDYVVSFPRARMNPNDSLHPANLRGVSGPYDALLPTKALIQSYPRLDNSEHLKGGLPNGA